MVGRTEPGDSIASLEQALAVLSDPSDARWGEAFRFLALHPEAGPVVLEALGETLDQLGVEPSGTDPATGEPVYRLEDVARAVGLPESALDAEAEDAPPGAH